MSKTTFEDDEEARFWRDVYIAAVTSPTPCSLNGEPTPITAFADNALKLFRERRAALPKGGPYR